MPQPHRDEVHFGSDSFLDVLANVVGILIILIVVVGVRMARGPVAARPIVVPEPEIVSLPIAPAEEQSPPADPVTEPPELLPRPVFPPLPELLPPQDLIDAALRLASENKSLQTQLQTLAQQAQQLEQRQSAGQTNEEALRNQLAAQTRATQQGEAGQMLLKLNANSLQAQLAEMQCALSAQRSAAAPNKKLVYRLPPISRVVSGDEIHFRLINNRVSRVPVSELAEEVRHELERRKEILLTRPFFQGRTRTVDGYSMDYILKRQTMTLAEEMRAGQGGMIRIAVSGWVISPSGQEVSETARERLQPGSRFETELRKKGPTATVTFWVYPDSFEIYRELKSLAHEAGFWVASRPLPDGVPIAGSPDGSKSLAQ